jgi:hypothetical protein
MKIYGSDIANAVSAMERAAQILRETESPKPDSIITLYVDLDHSAARLKRALGLIDVEIKDGE